MMMSNGTNDRRRELRFRADELVRWKRPGRIEDHKAWVIDRSDRGLGFITLSEALPKVGDSIHLRKRAEEGWATIESPVRITRVQPLDDDNLMMIGCRIGE